MFNFFRKQKIDENTLNLLTDELIAADLGVEASTQIIKDLFKTFRNTELTVEELKTKIKEIILANTTNAKFNLLDNIKTYEKKPFVLLIAGVNGSGKTTSIAKLTKLLMNNNLSVLLSPCDTFRSGAYLQLKKWADKLGASIFNAENITDPAAVAYKSVMYAKENNIDVVIVDTSGRLDNNINLMQELSKIDLVLKKINADYPNSSLLVIDGTTGSAIYNQAQNFSKAIKVSGIIVTKLDSNSKGGGLVPVMQNLKLPVAYIGFGETEFDLKEFNTADYINNLLSL